MKGWVCGCISSGLQEKCMTIVTNNNCDQLQVIGCERASLAVSINRLGKVNLLLLVTKFTVATLPYHRLQVGVLPCVCKKKVCTYLWLLRPNKDTVSLHVRAMTIFCTTIKLTKNVPISGGHPIFIVSKWSYITGSVSISKGHP